jgi:hypothetical protein
VAAKSKDPVVEVLRQVIQGGDWRGAELPSGAGAAELEAFFLAELRKRRERLARWMQSIQEEATRSGRPRPVRWHRCRGRAAGKRMRSGF